MSTIDQLAHAADLLGDRAQREVPIGPRTTYRVGGAAALFAEIADEEALAAVTAAVSATGVPVLALGRGSNLLVADDGFRGLCVVLTGAFCDLQIDSSAARVTAGGGLDLPVLARRSAAAGVGGLEWLVGIPGSVGGAVRMNAGGHGAQTAERLVSARVVDLSAGVDRVVDQEDLGLAYRRSGLGASDLVVAASFRGEPSDPARSAALIAEIVGWRRAHQPGGRNAGSVFSNPPGDAAGRLIDAAGLKGMRIGSAEVSEKHANFIQADAGGRANDVYRLALEVRRLVAERLGVTLALELRSVGEFR